MKAAKLVIEKKFRDEIQCVEKTTKSHFKCLTFVLFYLQQSSGDLKFARGSELNFFLVKFFRVTVQMVSSSWGVKSFQALAVCWSLR